MMDFGKISIQTAAQSRLAAELGLAPQELSFHGVNEFTPGERLLYFNVDKPGHALHHSTRSIRVGIRTPRGLADLTSREKGALLRAAGLAEFFL